MNILNIETAIINLDQTRSVSETKNGNITAVKIFYTDGASEIIDLPKEKTLKDFPIRSI